MKLTNKFMIERDNIFLKLKEGNKKTGKIAEINLYKTPFVLFHFHKLK